MNSSAPKPLSPVDDWNWLTRYLQKRARPGFGAGDLPRTSPCAWRSGRARDCDYCARIRGNAWLHLSCLPPSRSFKSAKLWRCSAPGLAIPLPSSRIGRILLFPQLKALASLKNRSCGIAGGFRAPYLRATAQAVAGGEIDFVRLKDLPLAEARAQLLRLPGSGSKSPIASCFLPLVFDRRFLLMSG